MARWALAVLALLLCPLRPGRAALPAPAGTGLREWGGAGGRQPEEAAALRVGARFPRHPRCGALRALRAG